MGQEGFLLKHEVLGSTVPVPQHGTTYTDLVSARNVADELWWTADARASHQSIVNLSTHQEMVRRPDGSWMTLTGGGRTLADVREVVDVRPERGWRPFRGKGSKDKIPG
jgi:hypothetical protein